MEPRNFYVDILDFLKFESGVLFFSRQRCMFTWEVPDGGSLNYCRLVFIQSQSTMGTLCHIIFNAMHKAIKKNEKFILR